MHGGSMNAWWFHECMNDQTNQGAEMNRVHDCMTDSMTE